MQIEVNQHPTDELEIGDIVVCGERTLYFVSDGGSPYYLLIDLHENDVFASNLNHPIHALNHIKKHISPHYLIYKAKDILISMGG
jgi:hypothetical protein